MANDTNDAPIACALDAGGLQQRLAEIAEIGASSLISRETDGDRHLLRFRANADTRRRLEGILAAEAECCTFLDLSLSEMDGDLALSIAAPQDAQALADELAGAYLVWIGLRDDKGLLVTTLGVLALGLYGVVATLQPENEFGRVLAAYGGVFIVGSIAWGMAFDSFRPDRYDLFGAAICLVGVAVIMYAPR
jgi:small multidrug resistance family-3 protein